MIPDNDKFVQEAFEMTSLYFEKTKDWSRIQHFIHMHATFEALLQQFPVNHELIDHLMESIKKEVYRLMPKVDKKRE